MRQVACALGLLALGSVAPTMTMAADKGTPLFDGKTLKGWKQLGGTAKYEVKDGTILGSSVPNTKNSAVRLYRSFGDFILAFSAVDADFLARPDEVRAADVQRWQDAYADVDPEEFPNLAAEAPIVVAHAETNTFALCLELLLDRIEQLAR